MFIDAHLDIAYNASKWGRDFMTSVADVRHAERKKPSPTGIATVAHPDLVEAGFGLVFGSIFLMPKNSLMPAFPHTPTTFTSPEDAHHKGIAQLDYYHRLTDEHDHIRLVGDLKSLEEVVASHQPSDQPPNKLFGIMPAMEGATPIRHPEEAEMWYERGLRMVGLAWDDTPYAPGAWREAGGLTKAGHHLLEVMGDFGFIADISHMSERASLETLDSYDGMVVATHSNARAIVPGERQLSDTQIQMIGEREGVIGVVMFNMFWKRGHPMGGRKEAVTLDHVVAHIDHICQVLGSAEYVGIGTDFDGGFGRADVPAEIDSVVDMPKIGVALREKGYGEGEIAGIFGNNWLNLLRRTWKD